MFIWRNRHDARVLVRRHVNSRVGLILQNTDHLHRRTIIEELNFAARPSRENTDRRCGDVAKMARRINLARLARSHPSVSFRRRKATPGAGPRRPSVLILDEPTSGLDGRNMGIIGDMVEQLTWQGFTVPVITHDLELMAHTCTDKLAPVVRRLSPNHSNQGDRA